MQNETLIADRQQAEQALSESEQRYRRLLAATTDYIYTVEVNQGHSGRTLHGPGCATVTGYTSAEFTADPYLWYRVIHEEDRAVVLEQAARILAGETPPPLEHRLLHKEGEVRWVRNTPIPHRDPEGRLVAYDGLISDITHRKQAELLLAADHAIALELAETEDPAAVMTKILEHLCRVLFWHYGAYWHFDGHQLRLENESWRAPLNAGSFEPPNNIRGPLDAGVGLPGRVCSEAQAIWIRDIASGAEMACLTPSKDGSLHCGCAFPVRTDHEILGVVEIYSREVHETDERMLDMLGSVGVHIGQCAARQRFKKRLEQERNLLRTLIDNLPDCIFVKDQDGRFLLNNLAHMRLLGEREPEKVIGKTDLDFFPLELAQQHCKDENAIRESGLPMINWEEPMVDHAGRHCWFLCTKIPLKNGDGKTIGLVGIGRDITERKEAAERLTQANAKLARRGEILKNMVRELKSSQKQLQNTQLKLMQVAKMELVGTLAAGVAHEVKNPLQTILLGVRYLSQKFPGAEPELALTLDEMRGAVNRANSIIQELLGLSSTSDFQPKPGDLNGVIERSLRLMHNELVAARIEIRENLSGSLPQVSLDAGRLQQVFINCFMNAIQAMPGGGTLMVTTRSMTMDDKTPAHAPLFNGFTVGDQLVVAEIDDTGVGIENANLPRVFDPFFTTKPVGLGSGLGLSISRRIVNLHGGNIDIQNRPCGGVRVSVVLKV